MASAAGLRVIRAMRGAMRVWGAVVILAAFAGRVVAGPPVPLLRIEAGSDVLEAGAAQILSVAVQTRGPAVVVTLDAGLRQALTALTSVHVGEALVLTVCGREVSRPLLYQPVTGGAFAIQEPDLASIQHLAAVLRAKDCASAPLS